MYRSQAMLGPDYAKTEESEGVGVLCDVCREFAGDPERTLGLCSRCHAAAVNEFRDPIQEITSRSEAFEDFVRRRHSVCELAFERGWMLWASKADEIAHPLAAASAEVPRQPVRTAEALDALLGDRLLTVSQASMVAQYAVSLASPDSCSMCHRLALRVVDPWNIKRDVMQWPASDPSRAERVIPTRDFQAVADAVAKAGFLGIPIQFHRDVPLTPAGETPDRRYPVGPEWLPLEPARQSVCEFLLRRMTSSPWNTVPRAALVTLSRGCRDSWSDCSVCFEIKIVPGQEVPCTNDTPCKNLVCQHCLQEVAQRARSEGRHPARCLICRAASLIA